MVDSSLGTVQPEKASFKEWVAVLSAMLGSFMAVVDILITNASLKEIQAALGATLAEGSWISTSYLIGEIIIIPLTAWLIEFVGLRRLTVWVSAGFIVSSLLCSMAWSLESMVVFRAMQGLCGGAFIPLGFTMTLTILPLHQRPIGMTIFGVTATFAPAIGPTIGGLLTEFLGWKFIFYINIPPGLIMIAGLMYGLQKTPINWQKLREADFAGIITMAVGLGCLETFLEEGYRLQWFESSMITTLAAIAFVSLVSFIIIQFSKPNPMLNLRVLKDRNLLLSCIAIIGLGIGLFGSVYIIPLYLVQIHGYTPYQVGMISMWMGIPQLLILPFIPLLLRYIEPRIMCVVGLVLFGYASFMSGNLNPDVSGDQLLYTQIIRALGQPLILVSISLIATSYISHQDSSAASSIFNVVRNLSGAVFISFVMTMLQNDTSRYYTYLSESVTHANHYAQERLSVLTQLMGSEQKARSFMVGQIQEQAAILAYNEIFHIMGCALIISVLAILFTRKLPPSITSGFGFNYRKNTPETPE